MSPVAQFANASLTDVSPGMLSGIDAARLDSPADPVMATPLIAAVFAIATDMLAQNIANYVNRNAH
ncbi:linaridin-like RiPP (plasmid) [Embleya sp. NBC_00888]|uniref:linaridin-like RiPP n=1 Tax=Embleya sp. NBC_00888 TaxID=2975960 RepID=UPI002F90DC5B|nr:linaridin-like RiPP [Embleya sp. NBC_00888]